MSKRILAILVTGLVMVSTVNTAAAASKPGMKMGMAHSSMVGGAWTYETTNLFSTTTGRVVGYVRFTYNMNTQMTMARVTVMGMTPMTVHPAHIHMGRCGSNGPVIYPFSSIRIGANGMGMTTTMFRGRFAHMPWYINVHLGPTMSTSAGAMPIACANVL